MTQAIVNQESPRTPKLYDRRREEVSTEPSGSQSAGSNSGSPTFILGNRNGKYSRRRRKHRVLGNLVNGSAIITLLTAVLFLSGWIYLSEYYASFGVDISSLDLPIYASLLASINAISPILGKFVFVIYIGLIAATVPVLMQPFYEFFWFRAFLGKLLFRIKHTFVATLRYVRRRSNSAAVTHDAAGRSAKTPSSRPSRDDLHTPTWVTSVLTYAVNCYLGLVVLLIALIPSVYASSLAEKDAERIYKQPRIKTVLIFKADERLLMSKEFLQINTEGGLRLLTQTKDFVAVFVKREFQPYKRGAFIIPTANLVAVQNELLNVKSQPAGKSASN